MQWSCLAAFLIPLLNFYVHMKLMGIQLCIKGRDWGGKPLSPIDKAHLYSGFETLIWMLIMGISSWHPVYI